MDYGDYATLGALTLHHVTDMLPVTLATDLEQETWATNSTMVEAEISMVTD